MSEPGSVIARLEHDELSPEFIAILRATDDLNHEDCLICRPPIYESGLVGRMWTRALDCPICGIQIRDAAEVLVRRDYERHLTDQHYPLQTTTRSRPDGAASSASGRTQ